jgi:hypothetical protein
MLGGGKQAHHNVPPSTSICMSQPQMTSYPAVVSIKINGDQPHMTPAVQTGPHNSSQLCPNAHNTHTYTQDPQAHVDMCIMFWVAGRHGHHTCHCSAYAIQSGDRRSCQRRNAGVRPMRPQRRPRSCRRSAPDCRLGRKLRRQPGCNGGVGTLQGQPQACTENTLSLDASAGKQKMKPKTAATRLQGCCSTAPSHDRGHQGWPTPASTMR